MYNRAHRFNRPNVGILLKIHHHNIFRDFGTLPSILQQILLFEYKKDNKIKFTIYIVLLMHTCFIHFQMESRHRSRVVAKTLAAEQPSVINAIASKNGTACT